MSRQRRSPRARAFTLIEVLIAIAVLAAISMLLIGAFASLRRGKASIQRLNDRHREGRAALDRISRDVAAAYLSMHQPLDKSLLVQKTAFVARPGSPADRLDFVSFSHRRLVRNAKESDQAEVGYFASENPELSGVTDLARREAPIDLEPLKGGRVQVLATDIDLFDLAYLDPLTGEWKESWDTQQATGEIDRLPYQVRVVLVLNGGERAELGGGSQPLRFTTKVLPMIPKPLRFAIQ